ncbi:hypothetical protein A2121_02860 [Candidatus Nomurabacteria bacterium GWB1_40_6]|uniref:HAD family hydrolase n=1 Tax=Candidatus Nomurabacteria bacterium GWB1_40_6 TaxID=1801727 RepID=A0A1F6TN97_9BACT|nr:MAG: HAD-superfamily hydrolase, subfamily IA, variant 3 [Parcubacteria group bacterium GW2011_GWC1_34_10]OGI46562.1 MAG: hypothetical protein A2121_02860 [Candidatus Nomurabacteria bacterium GWB1_40_6]
MIKAIAFDYGGVIEVTEWDVIQKIANSLGVTKEDWFKVYYSFGYLWNINGDNGGEVHTAVAKKLNASEAQISQMQKLREEDRKTRKINLELIKIIKDLKNKNYKVCILSNNSIALRQKLIDKNLIDLFDEIVISGEVGYQKPQPEIFEILLKNLEISSNELVFIDDSKQSLLGAENIGYIPLLFTNNEKLKKDLSEIL